MRNGSSESSRYLRSKRPELPIPGKQTGEKCSEATSTAAGEQLDMNKEGGGRTTHHGSETTQLDSGEESAIPPAQTTGQEPPPQIKRRSGPLLLFRSQMSPPPASMASTRAGAPALTTEDRGGVYFPADSSGFWG